ncbi:MAG: M1 family metallopeptidase [bacterium]
MRNGLPLANKMEEEVFLAQAKNTTITTPDTGKKSNAKGVPPKKPAPRRKAVAKRAPTVTTTKPKPVGRSDASFRLGRNVVPASYQIHLVPDLNRGHFRGEVLIQLDILKTTSAIEVHAADMEIDQVQILPTGGQIYRPNAPPPSATPAQRGARGRQLASSVTPKPGRETVEIKFANALRPGNYSLGIAFHAKLQKRLRGFYAAQSGNRRYAFTQLEAADARRCFPCFDEPDFKAKFTFSVTARSGFTVISNNPMRHSDTNPNGTTTWHFTETPKLSTYLCAVGVGELVSEEQRHVGTVPVRVWQVPEKSHLADFALECAVASLQLLEKYFGTPYPYEKLDLVAAPDFEAGAMENAGAVFFRETLLLVDPDTVTLSEKKRVAEVIAHELAHMWFGNLVTMKWWDDLWLNEAFATWMAFKIIDEWKPEWQMWKNFEPHRAAALGLDSLTHTHPIYAAVKNATEATENFDAITYEKGASVVRMVEHYLGRRPFQKGVRAYLKEHRESNAEGRDLWRALEKASGVEVEKLVKAWITQPGFPVVSLSPEDKGGKHGVRVHQERFLASPTTKVGKATPTTWPIPLVVRTPGRGKKALAREMVSKKSAWIALPGTAMPAWYHGNAAEGGFYRVQHDAEALAALRLGGGKHLAPVERMGLVGHEWALIRAGKAEVGNLLELLQAFADESDFEVLEAMSAPLATLDDQIANTAGDATRAKLQRWIRDTFGPAWRSLGWEGANDESSRLRRGALLRIVGLLGEDAQVAEEAAVRFNTYLEDATAIDPNLADALVAIAARNGDLERFTRLRASIEFAETPQERRRHQLALADFREPKTIDQSLNMTLTPEVATQDVSFLLMRSLANRVARPRTWNFIRDKWPTLVERLPPMMASRLVESTAALQTKEYRKEVASFFKSNPVPTGTRALKLALERFDIGEELRRRCGPQLQTWLENHQP